MWVEAVKSKFAKLLEWLGEIASNLP